MMLAVGMLVVLVDALLELVDASFQMVLQLFVFCDVLFIFRLQKSHLFLMAYGFLFQIGYVCLKGLCELSFRCISGCHVLCMKFREAFLTVLQLYLIVQLIFVKLLLK